MAHFRHSALRLSAHPFLTLAASALLSVACGTGSIAPTEVGGLVDDPYEQEALPELEGTSGPIVERQAPRRVGDKWVHRFSGSYRSGDLILREEVIAKNGDLLIVDFILSEGDQETYLQVEMSARSERIIAVSRIVDGKPHEATIEDFDAMMSKTTFIPDSNQGKMAKSGQTCLIGKNELDCELSEYRVMLGDEEATMTVARNEEIRRDLSGEITAVDGTVLYHAELIEMHRGEEAPAPADTGVAAIDLTKRD